MSTLGKLSWHLNYNTSRTMRSSFDTYLKCFGFFFLYPLPKGPVHKSNLLLLLQLLLHIFFSEIKHLIIQAKDCKCGLMKCQLQNSTKQIWCQGKITSHCLLKQYLRKVETLLICPGWSFHCDITVSKLLVSDSANAWCQYKQ